MDPWNNSYSNSPTECAQKNFEDDFQPKIFEKLPDSDQYLASLEAKLHKIKTDQDVIKQLQQKREECMNQLLNNTQYSEDVDLELDEPIESSTVLRAITPQKQALTQGEIVELVKYDQLKEDDSEVEEDNKLE
ncbi:coiled-coil domain-containing protein 32 [Onthophagus taurus]|uniref:coiled-coil domain-containing protein 32 n=1 Tax=Onthophagus taurus TaxID=166361 RepID=UPI000C2051FF|nr:uncharacterized protein LOC111426654 isoform X1 [Onthophagus taurus]